jgi:hypothetical protein
MTLEPVFVDATAVVITTDTIGAGGNMVGFQVTTDLPCSCKFTLNSEEYTSPHGTTHYAIFEGLVVSTEYPYTIEAMVNGIARGTESSSVTTSGSATGIPSYFAGYNEDPYNQPAGVEWGTFSFLANSAITTQLRLARTHAGIYPVGPDKYARGGTSKFAFEISRAETIGPNGSNLEFFLWGATDSHKETIQMSSQVPPATHLISHDYIAAFTNGDTPQQYGQDVDGPWSLTAEGLTCIAGYDRIFCVPMPKDYRVFDADREYHIQFTLESISSTKGLFGFIFNWQGHQKDCVDDLATCNSKVLTGAEEEWTLNGTIQCLIWENSGADLSLGTYVGGTTDTMQMSQPRMSLAGSLALNERYHLKVRFTNTNLSIEYGSKVWKDSEAEPGSFQKTGSFPNVLSIPSVGSLALLCWDAVANIHSLSVTDV